MIFGKMGMDEYTIEVRRTLLQMVLFAAAAGGGYLLAGRPEAVLGLVLGTVISAVYFLLMGYRVKRASELPPERAVAYMRAGWILRLCFVVLALVLLLQWNAIPFLAAVVGLFSLQIVMILNAAYIVLKAVLNGRS